MVFSLDPERVAKVWFDRTESEVNRLREFYRAAGVGGHVRVAQIEDVRTSGDHVVSVERFVAGRPVGTVAGERVRPDAGTVRQLGDALAGLADIPPHPALSSLPLLPGEPPTGDGASFTQSLSELVLRRVRPVSAALDDALGGRLDVTMSRTLDQLAALRTRRAGLVHGDLIPDNILVSDAGRPGLIDFGFLTTYGDPDFDVAITPAIFDMYGPGAARTTAGVTRALASRFGTPSSTIRTYRDAYALITAGAFGDGPADGHFAWCVNVLRSTG